LWCSRSRRMWRELAKRKTAGVVGKSYFRLKRVRIPSCRGSPVMIKPLPDFYLAKYTGCRRYGLLRLPRGGIAQPFFAARLSGSIPALTRPVTCTAFCSCKNIGGGAKCYYIHGNNTFCFLPLLLLNLN